MTELMHAASFLSLARRKMRSGNRSRVPMQLLRLERVGTIVNCDWIMRPNDPWDRFIPVRSAAKQRSLQALEDALSVRDMVFIAFPEVTDANLRVYREDEELQMQLMMTGTVNRRNEVLRRVPSVVMRAKLCGFRFSLVDGVLETLQAD